MAGGFRLVGIGRGVVTSLRLACCASLILAAITASAADDEKKSAETFAPRRLSSKWMIQAGGNLTAYDTTVAWSPQGLAGAVIRLEDSLGLDQENDTFFFRASRRFESGHAIDLMAVDLRRTASRIIDDEIEWGDYVFRAEGRVSTELVTRLLKLIWSYDFSDSDRLNAGISAGLSTFDLGVTLEGEARLESDEGEEWVEGIVEGADAIAPVPVIGFFLDYALSPRWVLSFRADAMNLSIGDHRGRVVDTDFSIEYGVSRVVGLGLGFGSIDMEYRGDEDDEKFGVDYRIESVGAHVTFSF
jgi:hypothetical protein